MEKNTFKHANSGLTLSANKGKEFYSNINKMFIVLQRVKKKLIMPKLPYLSYLYLTTSFFLFVLELYKNDAQWYFWQLQGDHLVPVIKPVHPSCRQPT